MKFQYFDSPVGTLRLVSDGGRISKIEFENQHSHQDELQDAEHDTTRDDNVLNDCARQLTEYFTGSRKHFSLPLATQGTPFQQSVWRALGEIPFGELRSYSDIAGAIGKPRSVRAVGTANGRNPLPIVVPCHRVIGSDGSLTGFAGGLGAKKFLLELEGHREQSGRVSEAGPSR